MPFATLIGYASSMPEIKDDEDHAWSRWREGLLDAVKKANDAWQVALEEAKNGT